MVRRRFFTAGPTVVFRIIALSTGLTALSVLPANAADPTLTADLAPTSASTGERETFTLTVSSNQGQLQSLSLDAPDGFFVGSATSVTGGGNVTVSGSNAVQVNNLRISGSAVLTLSIEAWAPCTPSATAYTWGLTAVQKGGTSYVPKSFMTNVTQSTGCELTFGSIAGQVKDAPFAVAVTVRRDNGTTDTSFDDPVSLTLEVDPGVNDATLTGGGSVNASSGVATFNAVKLSHAGAGYVLEACSPVVNNVTSCPTVSLENGALFTSNPFTVFDSRAQCTSSVCSNGATGTDVANATISGNGDEGSIGVGIWDVPAAASGGSGNLANLDCPGYDEISTEVVSFDYLLGNGTKVATVTISAEAMKLIADQGVAHLETCFAAEEQFDTKPGTPAATQSEALGGLWVGLLPDCPARRNVDAFAPCTISRTGGGAGTGKIVYIAAEGDPAGRH